MAREIKPLAEVRDDALALLRHPSTQAKMQSALARVGVTPERMTSWAMTAFRRQPKILKCDPLSIVGAVIQSAALGLDPSGVTGEAYLVPYGRECTLVPGYRGLMALARRSGQVSELMGNVVREGDEFTYEYGMNSSLKHVPSGGNGKITHAYAYCKFKDGGFQFVVLTADEIAAVRSKSRSKGIWNEHPEPMAIKSAIRRLAKYLPLKADEMRAFELAGQEERGESQGLHMSDFVDEIPDTQNVEAEVASEAEGEDGVPF